MAGFKYEGPSDVFYLAGDPKPYKVGDVVPISMELAVHMGRIVSGAHRFEGVVSQSRPRGSDIGRAREQAEREVAASEPPKKA